MKKLIANILTMAAIAALAVGPSLAMGKDCCNNGGSCCSGSCCKTHHHKV